MRNINGTDKLEKDKRGLFPGKAGNVIGFLPVA